MWCHDYFSIKKEGFISSVIHSTSKMLNIRLKVSDLTSFYVTYTTEKFKKQKKLPKKAILKNVATFTEKYLCQSHL